MKFRLAALTLLLLAAAGLGAPPEVPAAVTVKPGQLMRIPLKTTDEIGISKNFTDDDAFWGELVGPKGQRHFVFQPPALEYDKDGQAVPPKRTQFVVAWWTKGDLEGPSTTITLDLSGSDLGRPRPKPPAPPGPSPTPVDVKTFRVILIYDTNPQGAAAVTEAQNAILTGLTVEQWLNDNCTGGVAGWRRRSKNAQGDADPTMAQLWKDVQAKLTTTPCVAVEVNGNVQIIAFEATPSAEIDKLKTFRGTK